jgi:hypothetical protein
MEHCEKRERKKKRAVTGNAVANHDFLWCTGIICGVSLRPVLIENVFADEPCLNKMTGQNDFDILEKLMYFNDAALYTTTHFPVIKYLFNVVCNNFILTDKKRA